MKAWGLQFEKRLKEFTARFVNARCAVTNATEDLRDAERRLNEARCAKYDREKDMAGPQRAVNLLMNIGPEGLKRIEGEHGPELCIEQFLIEADNGGIK